MRATKKIGERTSEKRHRDTWARVQVRLENVKMRRMNEERRREMRKMRGTRTTSI